ncbi:MAG: shikimate dehydrogenase [Nitrososphaerales archaeon]
MSDNDLRTYCIIGDPVDHSLSPAMHNAAFKALNLNCVYIAFRIAKDELEAGLMSLRKANIAGFNVTMPHKVAVMPLLDELDETCTKIGAVNTVNNESGKFKGYNTDIHGFIEPIRRRKIGLKGKTILLMGAGGAARAAVAALVEQDVAKVVIASRNLERANILGDLCKRSTVECETINFDNITNYSLNADMIVNATPIGMKGEEGMLRAEHMRSDCVVYDLVYRPMETGLIRSAEEAGATVIYGYEMLLEQGAKSFEIWLQMEAPRDVMKKTLIGDFGK